MRRASFINEKLQQLRLVLSHDSAMAKAAHQGKDLWIKVDLLSSRLRDDSSPTQPGGVVCVSIPTQASSSNHLKRHVHHQLNLEQLVPADDVVYKLRDFNGALIPLSINCAENDISHPYLLEVVDIHQHVQARDWTIPELHRANFNDKIKQLSNRVENLEHRMDGLTEDYSRQIEKDIKLLATQTAVLESLASEGSTLT